MALTGVLKNWRIHILKLSDEERCGYGSMHPGYWPAVVTGQIEADYRGRWEAGACMRSSLVLGLDLETMRVTTKNSVYALQGRGMIEVVSRFPSDYALAVGETMMSLGVINLEALIPNDSRLH